VAFPAGDDKYKISAGWMIEQCGWKGRNMGEVGVYEKQALVLVNRGNCKGHDVVALSEAIINDVNTSFGIKLYPEVIII
jgi:UDP-N-acetylmuramate dehydrogenase